MSNFTHEQILKIIGNKSVYIYAANLEGIGICRLFTRLGIDVKGFLDSRKYDGNKRRGKPVISPEVFFSSPVDGPYDATKAFVLIATKHRKTKQQAIRQCQAAGLTRNDGYIITTDLCEYLPTIEVAGSCNLKCISCDVGLPDLKQIGLMTPEVYREVLTKMTREIPFLNSVCLYLWGEPFRHPQLAEIIRITAEMGIASDISSNLNYVKYMEGIVEAEPDLLTVPCSGIGDNYEMTHTGGSWEVYRDNLYKLREFIDKYKSETTVRIFYHMYKHNLEEDYSEVERIAKELGFYFFPILANIFPTRVFDYAVHGTPLPEEMMRANEMLIVPVEEQLKNAYANRNKNCPVWKAFPTVRSDRSVLQCCNMVKPSVHSDYLSMSLDDLDNLRKESDHCTKCVDKGIHRFFDVNASVSNIDGKRVITRD